MLSSQSSPAQPQWTSTCPSTHHLSLICSRHIHYQLIILGAPPSLISPVNCLSSQQQAPSKPAPLHHPPGHLLPAFHSSSVSPLTSMLSSQQSPAHHSLATSSPPATRHVSFISLSCSDHSYTSSSFSGHILSTSHSSSVSPLTSMLSSQPSPAHHPQATSTPPSTHHMSLISLSRSVHSHYQLIILWAYSLILSLVICLSSHQLALITAITSSSFPGTSRPFLILICLSSHLHALITTTVSSCHHFQAISFLPFTRHLSIISLSCSHHSHHEPLMPLGTSSPPFTRLRCRGPVGIHRHPPPATRRRSDTPPH